MKINDDKTRNYKYDEDYERNEYLSEWGHEDQRETARSTLWRRAS